MDLLSLFHANLKPTNWDRIDKEYKTVSEPEFAGLLDSAYQAFEPAAEIEGIDHTAAIQTAIDNEDKAALYFVSTRAVSQLTRHYLREAETKLTQPGAATEDVQQAQRIYRAFLTFISQTDPDAAKQLGLAWLTLSSNVGHAGISGIGGQAADPDKFNAARQVIESYLIDNFEVDGESVPTSLAPIPATKLADAITIAPWLPPGSNINNQDPLPLLALNFEERGFEETDLPLVAYGDMLFDSPSIFGEPARSMGIACSTCHNRSDINKDFFIPGVSHQPGAADVDGGFFNPIFNDQRSDSLDIPTLRAIRFTGPYGRDGRFGSLRGFVRNVIVNEFAGEEPSPFMLDALVAYMLEFDWQPNSLLNKDGTLNENASEAALRGEVLFNTSFEGMGDRSCSTCHIPSANFIDRLPHDIGSGNPASEFARDSAFDTPTLINVAYTAPYMHDGSLATLADVVDWFDSNFDLGLSTQDRADLTAYLEAVGGADDPWELFDEENTIFALNWAELSTFLSTLDTLIPAQDSYHAILLIETVEPDLRLDASAATNRSIIPRVYEIADKLDEIKMAIEDENWDLAADLNEEYKVLAEEYGSSFK
ncbi:cytochrome C [Chloroflexi bacterium TSY]|nr:cytochrome C [Chloroflexi bacterium TSY]